MNKCRTCGSYIDGEFFDVIIKNLAGITVYDSEEYVESEGVAKEKAWVSYSSTTINSDREHFTIYIDRGNYGNSK